MTHVAGFLVIDCDLRDESGYFKRQVADLEIRKIKVPRTVPFGFLTT
ncbi:hypothetical protein PMIT1306_00747 [Prochlorococcus sp. MIT 1306]|nr:hypothetical protein PMIT1306_00747 [Prochlorococcus sp. MIT 1306]